ncbi:hypothetical protein ACJJIF_18465 [Microbulbifer sp. SSSA002]|uniref:hypothetical protein n=1 Tax=Microbulbifer sp. SSSA002 TaxID=3243376 RepID=UPI0040393C05
MRLMILSNQLPHILAVVISLSLAFGSAPVSAQQQGVSADFWEKYDDITDWVTLRLQLTPAQKKVVVPILQQSFAEKKAVLKSHGLLGDNKVTLSPKLRSEIGTEMAVISNQSLEKLREVLSTTQMREVQKIQMEFISEVANRLRAQPSQ